MLREFKAAQRAHAQRLRKEVEHDPLVAAVLSRFPGSEVVTVTEGQEDKADCTQWGGMDAA